MTLSPSHSKCNQIGPENLTLQECVALVLRSSTLTEKMLRRFGTELPEQELECALFQTLEKNSNALFENIIGMSEVRRTSLMASFELGRRYHRFREQPSTHENISQLPGLKAHSHAFSKIPYKYLSDLKEWIGFVPIHSNHEIGQFCLVERGSSAFVHFEAQDLFAQLLLMRPKGYFLFHNHPSKNLTPSRQDIELTEKLRGLSRELGVPLIDHGIVSYNNIRWIMI